MTSGFHDVRFPLDVSVRSSGGPERRTDVVITASGREERNQRWIHSRRRYEAGYGVRSLAALSTVVAFFEERRGRLFGFRFRDRLDWQSCTHGGAVTATDQPLGTGDDSTAEFQLVKRYGAAHGPYDRPITKPLAASVKVAVDGVQQVAGTAYDLDALTGRITFRVGHIPAAGQAVTAGFAFDVPVRFDTDMLDVDLEAFEAGAIPKIPLVELIG